MHACTYNIQEVSTPHLLPSKSCNSFANIYHVADFNVQLEVVKVMSLECSHVSLVVTLALYLTLIMKMEFYLFIYLLVLYEAERPASKVCGQPVPTARKYNVHT